MKNFANSITSNESLPQTVEFIEFAMPDKAIFASPLAKQGLHPALLLGAYLPDQPNPEVSRPKSYAPHQTKLFSVSRPHSDRGHCYAFDATYNPEPEVKPEKLFFANTTDEIRSRPEQYVISDALLGSVNRFDTDFRLPKLYKSQWPFIPQRTVPGYVFEGAEFWNDNKESLDKKKKIHSIFTSLVALIGC